MWATLGPSLGNKVDLAGNPNAAWGFAVPGIDRPALAVIGNPGEQFSAWLWVTADGLGYLQSNAEAQPAFNHVHAVCAGSNFACFLTSGGRAACTDFECCLPGLLNYGRTFFQPGGLEPLVEIACGEIAGSFDPPKFACGLTASGDITCFGPGAPLPRANSPKFESVLVISDGVASVHPGPLVCGLTVGGQLLCWWDDFERTYSPPGAPWRALAANYEMFCAFPG